MIVSPPGRWPLDFVRVFDRIAGRLDEGRHPYALAGALALHAYGQSRATFDLDLLTVSAAQIPLLALFLDLGYETLHLSPGYSSHQHADPQWGGVDLIYVDETTAERLFPACTRHAQPSASARPPSPGPSTSRR